MNPIHTHRLLIVAAIAAAISFCAHSATSFRTAILADMARAMAMTDTILALPDGDHVAAIIWQNRPVTVSVRNGRVTHIGYSIFTAPHREAAYSPFFDAIERYALIERLPMRRQKTVAREFQEEGISFGTGRLSQLPGFYGDTITSFSLSNNDGKAYEAVWSRAGSPVVSVRMPYTYTLLHGTSMEEDESILISDLREAALLPPSSRGVRADSLPALSIAADSVAAGTPDDRNVYLNPAYPDSIYILPGESYYFESLNSNRYYTPADTLTLRPLFSSDYPAETLANLLTSVEVPNDLTIEVRVIQYNYRSTTVTLPLSNFIGYLLDQGCQPFFGAGTPAMSGASGDNGTFTGYLLMRNILEGYCHIMRIQTPAPVTSTSRLTARLNPYIPISKISSLFAD